MLLSRLLFRGGKIGDDEIFVILVVLVGGQVILAAVGFQAIFQIGIAFVVVVVDVDGVVHFAAAAAVDVDMLIDVDIDDVHHADNVDGVVVDDDDTMLVMTLMTIY